MSAIASLELLAPLSGVLLPLERVPDPVFSGRLIGDGVCIDPTSGVLCAPLSGVVSNIQDSGHAISITDEDGVQVLMHIGLDTVNLAGKGFTARVVEGERVEAGQTLIEFDADYLALHARSLLTLVLVVSGEPFSVLADTVVDSGQPLLRLGLRAPPNGVTQPELEEQEGEALFSRPLTLPNANGLHARPAAVLAQAAKGFSASVQLHKRQSSANAKSLVAIMGLQTARGDVLQLSAIGEDAQAAVDSLSALIADGCGETDAAQGPQETFEAPEQSGMTLLRGVCASPGSALGRVVQLSEQVLNIHEVGTGEEQERALLEAALVRATGELRALRESALGSAQAEIFRAHQELLEDPDLLEQAQSLLARGKSAAYAWRTATEDTAALFRRLGSELLAERAVDLTDVGQRVLKLILGVEETATQLPDEAILIADQLTPSQTASLDTRRVMGFATVGGGATSHVAILARALGLPALCGLPAQVLEVANGTPVLLDADLGRLHLEPADADVRQLLVKREQQRERRERDSELSHHPALTRDGQLIEVTANVASLEEVEQSLLLGGEGVGLLRSEFLYLERDSAPSVDEQGATYLAIARALGPGRNLVVRTLDVGGDKPLAYVPMACEANPFLGVRGIRLCLQRPELLRQQLRAVLACAGHTRLHILLPMVARLSELREARQLLVEEAQALGVAELPKLGIMIEVPSAALMADQFAPEVDFFSIGTNDLTQYTLAMDRDHPQLASQADSLHPAVLRLIASTVKAAHAHGKWVGVCGALASEALAVPVLLGLGVDELSVSVPLIPSIKATVREVSLAECQVLAQRILGQESAEQVREVLRDHQQATVGAPVLEH
ncbi:phosphoenolpyruvate--protein phosphotransferase [Pseudomonas asplenii]|uniref:phosphoenolpyruvate--protein phosphotransferase n=1 Tax=Pseudomonas asplenii TaxID=53407 RepID=UPI00037F330D|nr:phosphoenolpyruvate--protein phosphotransferase [Pseudomonas fuscovaginae]